MGDYDVIIEIDYYGDELNAVFRKGGRIYIYPLEEVQTLVDILSNGGAEVIDKTVYSQNERMTYEEFKERYRDDDEPDYLRY